MQIHANEYWSRAALIRRHNAENIIVTGLSCCKLASPTEWMQRNGQARSLISSMAYFIINIDSRVITTDNEVCGSKEVLMFQC